MHFVAFLIKIKSLKKNVGTYVCIYVRLNLKM